MFHIVTLITFIYIMYITDTGHVLELLQSVEGLETLLLYTVFYTVHKMCVFALLKPCVCTHVPSLLSSFLVYSRSGI